MPIKSVKMKISKNKKMSFFLMSKASLNPKFKFLGRKVCFVARGQTHRHTRKWLLWAPFQGFRSFSFNLSSRIGPIPAMGGYYFIISFYGVVVSTKCTYYTKTLSKLTALLVTFVFYKILYVEIYRYKTMNGSLNQGLLHSFVMACCKTPK